MIQTQAIDKKQITRWKNLWNAFQQLPVFPWKGQGLQPAGFNNLLKALANIL